MFDEDMVAALVTSVTSTACKILLGVLFWLQKSFLMHLMLFGGLWEQLLHWQRLHFHCQCLLMQMHPSYFFIFPVMLSVFFFMGFLCFFPNCIKWLHWISSVVIRNFFAVLLLDLFFQTCYFGVFTRLSLMLLNFWERKNSLIDALFPSPQCLCISLLLYKWFFLGSHIVVQALLLLF